MAPNTTTRLVNGETADGPVLLESLDFDGTDLGRTRLVARAMVSGRVWPHG